MFRWIRWTRRHPERPLFLLLLLAGCAFGASFYRPSPGPARLLTAPVPMVVWGPAGSFARLRALKPVGGPLVGWTEMAFSAGRLDPARLPAGTRVAVVLLPGEGAPGSVPPDQECRDHLAGLADELEEARALHGSYPERVKLEHCPLGGDLAYRNLGDDFELECRGSTHHLAYTSLQGFADTASVGRRAVLLVMGAPSLSQRLGGQPLGDALVLGLNRRELERSRGLLEELRANLPERADLCFHLQGPALDSLGLGGFECLEGRLEPSRRVVLQAFPPSDRHLPRVSDRKALTRALADLPADTPFALAVHPELFEALSGVDSLPLDGLSDPEQRHLADSLKDLSSGAVAVGAELELTEAGWRAQLTRLKTGRVALWAALPLASVEAGRQWLAGSPLVHRRFPSASSGVELRGDHLLFRLGQPDFPPAAKAGDHQQWETAGEPAAMGWFRCLDADGLATRVDWVMGVGPGCVWAEFDPQATRAATASQVPTLSADEPDPEADQDPIAWDEEPTP